MKPEDMDLGMILDAIADVLHEHGVAAPTHLQRSNYHELPDVIDKHLKHVAQQLQKNAAMTGAAWRKNTYSGY